MAKQSKVQSPQTSLFPFFTDTLTHPGAGLVLAGAYFVLMLYVGLKYHVVGDYDVETDFFWSYVPEAKSVLQGHFYIEDFRGPGYPALLAIVSALVGDFFRSGVVLSTFAASFVLFFSFETLKNLFRADLAAVGTILVAVNTTFVQNSYTAGTDMVFNAFIASSVYFLFRSEERRWSNMALFSVFAGLAYLTRYNGVFVVAAIPLIFLFINPYQHDWRERFKTAAASLGVFLATITPWGLYCLFEKGSFFYNRNYLNIAYEMFAKGKVPWDQYWNVEAQKFASLGQVVFADPVLFAGTVLNNLYDHFVSDLRLLLGIHVGAFVIAGIFLFIREKPTARQLSYYVFGGCFFLVLLLVFYGERLSMFLLPMYISVALRALSWQRLSGVRFWNKVHVGVLAAFVVVLWSISESYSFNKFHINSGPQEIQVIAETFKKTFGDAERGKKVLARKPHIAYYLDMTMETFPYVSTWEELETQARHVNASYLFYSLMEAGMRPQFQQLLDPRKAPSWLKPITYTTVPRAVLYRIDFQQSP